MSEASEPVPAAGDATEDSDVERVLNALTPLCEDMETFAGFSVGWSKKWVPGEGKSVDWNTVEVTFRLGPERHPREADRAMGMLQGHGYHVDRLKRGAGRYVELIIRVHVGDDTPEEQTPRGDGEQSSLG